MTITNSVFFAKSGMSNSQEEVQEACIANISTLERQKRLRYGIRQFVITLIILGLLVALDVNHFWRLPLLFMFWAAAVGYFQACDKT